MLTKASAELGTSVKYSIGIEHDARKEARRIAKKIRVSRNIYKNTPIPKHKIEKALKDCFDRETDYLKSTLVNFTVDEKDLFWSMFNQECRSIKEKVQVEDEKERKDNKFV